VYLLPAAYRAEASIVLPVAETQSPLARLGQGKVSTVARAIAILESHGVLEQSAESLGLSVEEIRGMVEIRGIEDSGMVRISSTADDSVRAEKVADLILSNGRALAENLADQLQQSRVARADAVIRQAELKLAADVGELMDIAPTTADGGARSVESIARLASEVSALEVEVDATKKSLDVSTKALINAAESELPDVARISEERQGLRRELASLDAQIREAEASLGPLHPDLVRLKATRRASKEREQAAAIAEIALIRNEATPELRLARQRVAEASQRLELKRETLRNAAANLGQWQLVQLNAIQQESIVSALAQFRGEASIAPVREVTEWVVLAAPHSDGKPINKSYLLVVTASFAFALVIGVLKWINRPRELSAK
jgi:uncharacterized protein involved in exopolysaccharide biosynthesis